MPAPYLINDWQDAQRAIDDLWDSVFADADAGRKRCWGTVASAGGVQDAGSGDWSSVRSALGVYVVTFNPVFISVPIVMLSLVGHTANALRMNATVSNFTVNTYTTTLADSAFSFMAFREFAP